MIIKYFKVLFGLWLNFIDINLIIRVILWLFLSDVFVERFIWKFINGIDLFINIKLKLYLC